MRLDFDFTDLRAFAALADSGSFGAAAGELNVSQPTLTRRHPTLRSAYEVGRSATHFSLVLADVGFATCLWSVSARHHPSVDAGPGPVVV